MKRFTYFVHFATSEESFEIDCDCFDNWTTRARFSFITRYPAKVVLLGILGIPSSNSFFFSTYSKSNPDDHTFASA